MTADRSLPESQEEILAEYLAAVGDQITPEDVGLYLPDPDTSAPPELANLSDAEWAALFDEPEPEAAPVPTWPLSYHCPEAPGGAPWLAGFGRDGSGPGNRTGFGDGGPLDLLEPGPALARFADDAHQDLDDHGRLDDDSLIGVLRAWRRLVSWAQARELAAVAALARRRPADGYPPAAAPGEFPDRLSEFIAPELAAALTLTGRAAEHQLGLALDLACRPTTAAALESGEIDLPRARILLDLLGPLDPAHADAVEAAVMPRAGQLTTSELRAALRRAILSIDPQAARRQREQAEREARVEHWADPDGTASLAGRNLPPAQALAASKRLTQIATAWKRRGALGGMDLLRAHAYLALLNGLDTATPPASLLPVPAPAGRDTTVGTPGGPGAAQANVRRAGDSDVRGPAGPDEGDAAADQQIPPGLRRPRPDEMPPLTGLVNLTIPLTTLLGGTDSPGEVPGYGPLDAEASRLLACALAGHRTTRWQIVVTGPDDRALAGGIARGPLSPAPDGSGWTVKVTAEPIAGVTCDHRNAEPGYRASPALQRLVRARTVTCTGPGCRRPAARCDLDHSIPYDDGGITCECNQAPLCRYCHRLKQSQGWQLHQPSPGVMFWITPAGRRYVSLPSQHPT